MSPVPQEGIHGAFFSQRFKLAGASECQPLATAAAQISLKPQTHKPQSETQSCSMDRACSQPITALTNPPSHFASGQRAKDSGQPF